MASVFIPTSEDHVEFKPIFDWLFEGEGKVVFGGETYRKELEHLTDIRKIFVLLERMNKVVHIDDDKVDAYVKKLKSKLVHRDFDDQHIVAIVAESKCQLICSKDKRAMPYFKNKIKGISLYPRGVKRPQIYTAKRHKKLLCKKNIAKVCS